MFCKALSSCRNFPISFMQFVGSGDFSSRLATLVNNTSVCCHWVFWDIIQHTWRMGNYLFPLLQSQTWFQYSLPYTIDHVTCSVHFYTLNVEAVGFCEMLVHICQPTCHYIPDHIMKLKLIYHLQKHYPCSTPFLVS